MAAHALSTAPSLLPLYAKAALTGPLSGALTGVLRRGGSGDPLPDSVYTLGEQAIDRAHLARYDQVCGFRVGDVLPPTYLHVLAFPLSVALMTEQAFPFPLVGLVHVENAITVHRPVRADEVVSFAVHAADLRPHPSGRQLDLVADATVDGEPVWSGRSTYLRRGKPTPGTGKPPRTELGEQQGPLSVLRVPENIGRRYGAVSGDRNPIHLHALTARAFGFPTAIGHGMWLAARVLAGLEGRLPDAMAYDVAFKTPVVLPSSVAITTPAAEGGWDVDVRSARSGKPHLAGTVRPAST